MNPAEIDLVHRWSAKPHHPALTVLDVALQAAIQVLRQAHPDIDRDGDDSPTYDERAPTDIVLAQILVTSALALLQTLRHYRTVQQEEISF